MFAQITRHRSIGRRAGLGLFTVTAVALTLAVAVPGATRANRARADTVPAAATGQPATFSADPLPTVQTNGVVWANLTLGNTTYAAGNFSYVRPAGLAPTAAHTGQTQVGGTVAFTTSSGVMRPLTAFRPPTLNASGYALAASPDGQTIYLGGSFTTVNGQPHAGIVAFSAATGAVSAAFTAQVPGRVDSIVATSTEVYIGGNFLQADNVTRYRLAALDATTGALEPWAPIANGTVQAMVFTPDHTRVIIGGSFTYLNALGGVFGPPGGATAIGMGSLDATTGATEPWAVNRLITDSGSTGSIDTLSTDGTYIFGAGYATSITGDNFEGRFAADPMTGNLVWDNDCFGDTYSTLPVNGVLYSTGHQHDCDQVGAFPDSAIPSEPWHRSMAETTTATGGTNVIGSENRGGAWDNFVGTPDATVLDWFPVTTPSPTTTAAAVPGTVSVSGAAESGWDQSSNGSYLVIGGEMSSAGDPGSVSYLPHQQGLVRYAIHSLAPNKVGPFFSSVHAPTATASGVPGTANITWTAAWDRDNQDLTYQLFRDGSATALTTMTMPSTFWQLRGTGNFTDTGLAAGAHTYVLKVTDPDGNWVKAAATVTVTNAGPAPVSADLALDQPAAESSVAPSYGPGLAVDGNPSGVAASGSMSITSDEPQAWWETDLRAVAPINKITIWGRTDAALDQSSDLWVFVSNNPLDQRLTPAQQARQPGVWSTYQAGAASPSTTLTVRTGVTGRYVMVQHGGTDDLSLAEVQVFAPPAPPVPPTAKVLYSTDAGATWTATPTAAAGSTVLVRQWFNNPGDVSYTGESLTTTAPAGTKLVAGSTQVCDSPLTTNPVTPNAGQDVCSSAIAEATAWTGAKLAVSPSAALFGQGTSASGILDMGKVRYLNLNDCLNVALAGSYVFTSFIADDPTGDFDTGTTASNSPQSAVTCEGGPGWGLNGNDGVQNIDLRGNRYLNLDDCLYQGFAPFIESAISTIPTNQFEAATNASNQQPATASCGPAPGFSVNGGVQNIDLLGNRYLSLDECLYQAGTWLLTSLIATAPTGQFVTGTTASNRPQANVTCGAAAGWTVNGNSAVQNIDLLDPTRGQGFAQYALTMPSPAATTKLTQVTALTGPAGASATGTITVTR